MKTLLKLLLLICALSVNAQNFETETYGEHPQQLYDIYESENLTEETPILLFLHGGGWWAEHRQRDYYRPFINLFNSLHPDLILINADYRLLVEGTSNSVIYDQINDVVSVINQVIEDYSDNPLYLFGNSAGGQLSHWVYYKQNELNVNIDGIIPIATPYSGENGYWEQALADWQQEVFVSQEVDLQGLTPNQYASPRIWHTQELDNILFLHMSGDPQHQLDYILEDYPNLNYHIYDTWHSGWMGNDFKYDVIQRIYDFVTRGNLSVSEIQPNEKPHKIEYFNVLGAKVCEDCYSELEKGVYFTIEHYKSKIIKSKIIKR